MRTRAGPMVLKAATAFALAFASAGLGGCSSFSAGKYIDAMPAGVALPAGTPERPAEQAAYPAVHDMPPPRPIEMMTESEQERAEQDLVKVRDRQEAVAGTAPAKKKPATKPADSAN